MSPAAVKRWVRANLSRKCEEMGVPHWRIEVGYCEFEPEDGWRNLMQVASRFHYERARITVDPNERARITVDPTAFTDLQASDLESHFEHELLHLAHSPFDLAFDVAREHFPEAAWDSFRVAFNLREGRGEPVTEAPATPPSAP